MDKKVKKVLIGLGMAAGSTAVIAGFGIGVVLSTNNVDVQQTEVQKRESVEVLIKSSGAELTPTLTAALQSQLEAGTITATSVTPSRIVISNENNDLNYTVTELKISEDFLSLNAVIQISAANYPDIAPVTYEKKVDTKGIDFSTPDKLLTLNSRAAYLEEIIKASRNRITNNFLSFPNYQNAVLTDSTIKSFYSQLPTIVSTLKNSTGALIYLPQINPLNIEAIKTNSAFEGINMSFEFMGYSAADNTTGNISMSFRATTPQLAGSAPFNREFTLEFTTYNDNMFIAEQIINKHFEGTSATLLTDGSQRLQFPKITTPNRKILPSFVRNSNVELVASSPDSTVTVDIATNISISENDLFDSNNLAAAVRNPDGSLLSSAQRAALVSSQLRYEVGYVGQNLLDRFNGTIPPISVNSTPAQNEAFDARVWTFVYEDPSIENNLKSVIGTLDPFNTILTKKEYFLNQSQSTADTGYVLTQIVVSLNGFKKTYFRYIRRLANDKTIDELFNGTGAIKPAITVLPNRQSELGKLLPTSFINTSTNNFDTETLLANFRLPNQNAALSITQTWPNLRYKIVPDQPTSANDISGTMTATVNVYATEADLENDENVVTTYRTTLTGFADQRTENQINLNRLITEFRQMRPTILGTDKQPVDISKIKAQQVTKDNVVLQQVVEEIDGKMVTKYGGTITLIDVLTPSAANITRGIVTLRVRFSVGTSPNVVSQTSDLQISGFLTDEKEIAIAVEEAKALLADVNALTYVPENRSSNQVAGNTEAQNKALTLPGNLTAANFSINPITLEGITKISDKLSVSIPSVDRQNDINGSLNVNINISYNSVIRTTFPIAVNGFRTRGQLNIDSATIIWKRNNPTVKASTFPSSETIHTLLNAITVGSVNQSDLSIYSLVTSDIKSDDKLGTLEFTYKLRDDNQSIEQANSSTVKITGFLTDAQAEVNEAKVVFKVGVPQTSDAKRPENITNAEISSWIQSVTINDTVKTAGAGTDANTYSFLVDSVTNRTNSNENGTITFNYRIKSNNLTSVMLDGTITGLVTNDQSTINSSATPVVTLKDTSKTKKPDAVQADDFIITAGTNQGTNSRILYQLMFPGVEGYNEETQKPVANANNENAVDLWIKLSLASNPNAFRLAKITVGGFTAQSIVDQNLVTARTNAINEFNTRINSADSSFNWWNTEGNQPTLESFEKLPDEQKLAMLNFTKESDVKYAFTTTYNKETNPQTATLTFTVTRNAAKPEQATVLINKFFSS
ncbi:lipoprotein-associated protein [Mycoplasma testudineum]|uniref:Lipoprotein-associated protein n=1 Tax=Mycoplasma testudineum TaxID=244584 RepID=A0A4R6IB24_9MOLU|nr:lipoprotein 17-related variable surface protein [Mycoplasma testudineum]OYD26568.1 hypothetical protein CG473_02935 [Mycoplasma testudineum]TDO19400.1 lipoprotein-associated protein [Mycoplasma testudineum]